MRGSRGLLRYVKAICVVAAIGGTACGTSLRGTTVHQKAEPPANVLAVFRVESVEELIAPLPFLPKNVHPVTDLDPGGFKIFEDGAAVGTGESASVTRLDLGRRLHVLILVDFGGDPSEADRIVIGDALHGALVNLQSHTVGVFAFDGSGSIAELVTSAQPTPAESVRDAIKAFKVRDPSTNLHGAVVEALTGLGATVRDGPPPVQAGALVLVSRGPDRAGRSSRSDVLASVREDGQPLLRYAVGVGTVDTELLGRVTHGDPAALQTMKDLPAALDTITKQIAEYGRSHYALTYCSQAREGLHKARVEFTREVKDADGETTTQTGGLDIPFEAKGFRPGCKPTTLPPDLSGQK